MLFNTCLQTGKVHGIYFTEVRTSRAIAKYGELPKVLGNSQINMATRRKLLEACVRSKLLYAPHVWFPNSREINELEVYWYGCLCRMVKGGFSRERD